MAQSNSTATGVSASRSALGVLFSVVFLDNLGFAIVVPYLFFYARDLGASALEYGFLLASYSLMSFLFTALIARLSDRYGRRNILLPALAVSGFSYVLFGTAQTLWILFAARAIAGTTAATVPVAQAYVADVTNKTDRLRYLGLLGAAAGIAFILGPAIGGTLSTLYGYAVPSFVAAALAFANLASAYYRLPESPHAQLERTKTLISLDALRDVLRKSQVRLLLAVYFLFFVAFVFLQSALSPWLLLVFGFGSFQAGLVFFFIGAVSAFTQAVLLPKLGKNRSRLTLILYSIGVFVAGLLVLAVTQNLPLLFASAAVVSFGFGVQYITLNTLISINAPNEAQGGTLGLAWALVALAQTIGPVLATTTFTFGDTAGFNGLVFVVSALIAVAAVPLILRFKKLAKDE